MVKTPTCKFYGSFSNIACTNDASVVTAIFKKKQEKEITINKAVRANIVYITQHNLTDKQICIYY